ncbi:hypothetical protein [Streptomyces sp. JNUCC 63]
MTFKAPCFIGDTIHPVMEAVAKKDKAPGGVVTLQEDILNQRDEVVVSARSAIRTGSDPEASRR